MATYIFSDSTGAIVRILACSFAPESSFVADNTPSGQTSMPVSDSHPVLSNPSGWQVLNGVLSQVVLTPAQLLAQAQKIQVEVLEGGYQAAMSAPIAYMGTSFPNGGSVQQLLSRAVQAYTLAGAVPSGFFVMDVNGNKTPMTLAQLNGMVAAVAAVEWAAFQRWTLLQEQVAVATTVEEVEAIAW